MKTIHRVENINSNAGTIKEIVEFEGKKFKLEAALTNGSNKLNAEIMDSDGVFNFVLGSLDVDFRYEASYVSDASRKKPDLEFALKALKKVIKVVYQKE